MRDIMKLQAFLILAVGALVLAACSSIPTKVEHGTIHARTFSFVDPGAKPHPYFSDNRQIVHTMIQDAIAKNLAGRGLSKAAAGGEITVAYLVIIENNVSPTSIRDYYGYNSDVTVPLDEARSGYAGSKNGDYFEAGTLVIDIIDSKSFKLLKRGYATRQLFR